VAGSIRLQESAVNELRTIAVFCGANSGTRSIYTHAAVAVGREIARRGLNLVYGGGSVGLMGAVAQAALAEGAQVVGVIPHHLTTVELMGRAIGELIVVNTMHERKAQMAARADGFVVLPGGFGTLDELFDVVTWGQLGLHSKPVGLLDVDGYFAHLLAFLDHGVAHGFIRPHHRRLILTGTDPARLLDALATYEAPPGLVRTNGLEQA
jgi:uncharacterized protein (TIGR00730 family)